jgi:hypothetical protein
MPDISEAIFKSQEALNLRVTQVHPTELPIICLMNKATLWDIPTPV